MIRFPGVYKVRDANALSFTPYRRRFIGDDDWRIAGEDADGERTYDASAPLSEEDAQREKLHAINLRNAAFWEAIQYV